MKGRFIRIDEELELYCEQAGHGSRVVVLVPGWTMSTEVFVRQLDYFDNSETYRLVTFDPRAHGRSSKTKGGHDYEQHGRDLNALIDELGLDHFILGGWSFGCLEALAYINQFGSDRLAGFMMLDGPPRAAGEDNLREWVTYRYDDADGGVEFFTRGRINDPATTKRMFSAWMLEDRGDANIDWLVRITEGTPDTVAAQLIRNSLSLDYRKDLIALDGRIPLCYVVREDRRQVVTGWACVNTPSAAVHAFGEHLMFWERAAEFNSLLAEFADHCFHNPSPGN